jgi:hypothetical protein
VVFVKKMTYLLILAFLCLVLIPSAIMAATSPRIIKTSNVTNTQQDGGSMTFGEAYYHNYATGVIEHPFQYAWSTGLLLNDSILAYLQSTAPTTSVAALLAQFNTVGAELVLTGASGVSGANDAFHADSTQYTYDDLVNIASGFGIGERGGVKQVAGNSVSVGTDITQKKTNQQVGHKIQQTVTTNYDNVNYTMYMVSAERWVSPLVLDMTGKGVIEASKGKYLPHRGMTMNNAMLVDFYNNGFEVAMEWVGPNDGLLVAPKADGSVDATCMFGTAGGFDNGYEHLSLLDKNSDKAISGDELNGLCVWQDKNQNGIVDQGEMTSCKDAGISAINLKQQNFVGSFVRNGKTFKMWDWWPTALEVSKIKK